MTVHEWLLLCHICVAFVWVLSGLLLGLYVHQLRERERAVIRAEKMLEKERFKSECERF